MKICARCKIEKSVDLFGKDATRRDGLNVYCRECANHKLREWTRNNLSRRAKSNREYRARNPETVAAWRDRWEEENWDRIAKLKREWQLQNKERYEETNKRFRQNNPNAYRAIYNRWQKKRRATPVGKLTGHIGTLIRRTLKGQKRGKRTIALLGFSYIELKDHIEKQFTDGMSWENYGMHWQIDHRRPIASFSFDNLNDSDLLKMIRECWGLANLRPLLRFDNRRKSSIWNGFEWRKGVPIKPAQGYGHAMDNANS